MSSIDESMMIFRRFHPQMMQELYEGIRALERNRVNSLAKRLRQTIATLEADWETLVELTNRLEVFSQEVVARDKKLKQVNQTYEGLIKKLMRKIDEKSLRNSELELEIKSLTSQYEEWVEGLEEQVVRRDGEIQDLRDEVERLRQTVTPPGATTDTFRQISSRFRQLKESRSRLELFSR